MKKLFLFLTFIICANVLFAQRTITGKVTDDKGNPLPDVSITVKGTNTGTTTKADGLFVLQLPAKAKDLVFSSVNMEEQTIAISSSSSISVTLKPSTKGLDEVFVVAYGTLRKEALTGSISQIKAEQLLKRPLSNVLSSIEGSSPGVVVSSANGQPGSREGIRIRGFGSINATSEPLLIIDGVPYVGSTSNINPDDVENITILKDAASTALYGSRAANGVIIVTTKKGKKGRSLISARILQGVATRGLSEYERLDAKQYYPALWEAYRNSLVYPATGAALPKDIASQIASGLLPRNGSNQQVYNGNTYSDISQLLAYNPFNVANNSIVGTDGQLNPAAQLKYPDDLDWTSELMRNGTRRDYSVNFSGGMDKSDYYVSLGHVKQDGYTLNTDFKRYTARVNVNVQAKPWFKTGLNFSGNYSLGNTVSNIDVNGNGTTSFVNPFFFSRNIGPIYPVYQHNATTGAYVLDANGNRVWDLGNLGGSAVGIANGISSRPGNGFAGRHTLAETSLNRSIYKRIVTSARNYTDFTFIKNFKFTNNVAIDIESQESSLYENTVVGDGAPGGRLQKSSGSSTGFTASQLVNYNNKFSDHKIDVLAGHESYNQTETDLNGFKQGQSLTGNTEFGNFTSVTSLGSSTDKYRVESFFSRINYDYQNKYFLSGSIRRDGNSRFAAESRWGTFWSIGGGWNLEKEKFLADTKWIDQLKLRSSYGVVGVADGLGSAANNLGFYAYQGLYNFNNNAAEPGITQNTTAFLNRELSWEINKQFDLGLDFIFLNGRLTGSLEYYHRLSDDLLFAVPLPLSSGGVSVNKNTVTMVNKGIEFQASADFIKTKNFTWNTTINASTVANKITKLPASVPEFITGTKKYSVGHSIYDYWLPTYYGVDPSDGSALYNADNKLTTTNRRILPGKNGGNDTVTTSINNAKFAYQGTVIPDLYGSFSQSFSYKQFTVSALFSYQLGGKIYDGLYQDLMVAGNYGGARHKDILKRWQNPGDLTNIPRLDAGAQRATDFNANSSRWLIDGSYLNIRSISVSYSVPLALLSRLKISSAQFFVSGENLAYFSKRKGMNIQQSFSGVTTNAYPPARIVTAGLTITL